MTFTPEVTQVIAVNDIVDPTGDTDLLIPTGTTLTVVEVLGDTCAIVTDGKVEFPIDNDEVTL